jgi:nicotinate-nucleotide adenylyltransferase
MTNHAHQQNQRPLKPAQGRAVVIFGGTFDPVHYGHLRAASEVKEALSEAELRLLPSGTPPHRDHTFANAQHRLAMLELVLKNHPDFTIDQREILRNGPSYMVDTLKSIRQESPDISLSLVVGQDAANDLDRWHRWQELFELCHLIVMTRPESASAYSAQLTPQMQQRSTQTQQRLLAYQHGLVLHLPVTQLAISSTGIRQQIQQSHNPRFLLPVSVIEYIKNHQLYR